MIWEYCEDCYIDGHCENQDRGYKCDVCAKRIIDKCNRLQKQLDISVKCLKQYANRDNWYNTYRPNSLDECPIASKNIWKKEYGYRQAEEVLEKIEELNK